MSGKWFMLLAVFCALASCVPTDKCSGDLVFDEEEELCEMCPKDATFKDGTCICKAGYAYKDFKCVLVDAYAAEPEDAGMPPDSGTSAGGSSTKCQDYCTFANVCIGMSSLASSLLSDIVMGLHADDPASCKSSCQSTVGSGESNNAVLECIIKNQDQTMCKDPNPQVSLASAFGTIGQCCGTRQSDPMCKSICTALKTNMLVSSMIEFCP